VHLVVMIFVFLSMLFAVHCRSYKLIAVMCNQ